MFVGWPLFVIGAGVIFQSFLAWYVFSKHSDSKLARAFLLLSLSLVVWEFCYMFSANSIVELLSTGQYPANGLDGLAFDHPANVWNRLAWFGIAPSAPALFYMVLLVFIGLEGKKDQYVQIFLFSFAAVLIAANIYGFATSTAGITEELYWFSVAYSYAFIIGSVLVMLWKLVLPSYLLQRKQAFVFTMGAIVAFAGNLLDVFNIDLHPQLEYFDPTSVLFTVTSLFLAIGILKYKLFLIEPAAEDPSEGEAPMDLSMGSSFVVYEEFPKYGVEIFSALVKHYTHGLAFIPNDIEEIRGEYDIPKTPMLRTDEKASPTTFSYSSIDDRDYMLYIVKKFTEKSPNSIVFIGGLDVLAKEDAGLMVAFLSDLWDNMYHMKSRLLLSVPKEVGEMDELKPLLTGFAGL